jgi:hypothetical protein
MSVSEFFKKKGLPLRDPAAAAGPRLMSGEILDKNQCNLLLRDVAMLKGASSSCWRDSTFLTLPCFINSPLNYSQLQSIDIYFRIITL